MLSIRWTLMMLGMLGFVVPMAGCPGPDGDDDSADDDDAVGDDDAGDDDAGDDDAGDDDAGDDDAGDDDAGDDDAGDDDAGDDDAGDDDAGDDDAGDDDAGDDDAGDDDVAPCGFAELTTRLELRDAAGAPATSFATTDDVHLAGIIDNGCPFEVTVTSISTCLIATFTVTEAGGAEVSQGLACGDALVDWVIPGNDSIEASESMGALPAGSYTSSALFEVQGLPTPTGGAFVVQ
jgi:hypothetical protein